MALRAMVALAGASVLGLRTGDLLGVNDDALPLPPLATTPTGVVVAKWKATAGQAPGQVWDRTVEDFVTPVASAPAKESVEADRVVLAYARWSMWNGIQTEMTAGGNAALATYAGNRKAIWRAILAQAVADHQAAS